MRRRAAQEEPSEDQSARFAWWASFLVTLVLVGLLSIVHSAQAQTPVSTAAAGPFTGLVFEEESEGEEGWEAEEEDEECFWDEEEEELWCDEELEEDGAAAEAAECIVTDVDARVAARPDRERLELTVRYRGERSAAVAISWRLRGGKGELSLGTERARFSRSGTYRHLETGLKGKRMRKALAAREFQVEVRAVNTPTHCKRDLTTRLSGKRSTAAGPYWFERAARRG